MLGGLGGGFLLPGLGDLALGDGGAGDGGANDGGAGDGGEVTDVLALPDGDPDATTALAVPAAGDPPAGTNGHDESTTTMSLADLGLAAPSVPFLEAAVGRGEHADLAQLIQRLTSPVADDEPGGEAAEALAGEPKPRRSKGAAASKAEAEVKTVKGVEADGEATATVPKPGPKPPLKAAAAPVKAAEAPTAKANGVKAVPDPEAGAGPKGTPDSQRTTDPKSGPAKVTPAKTARGEAAGSETPEGVEDEPTAVLAQSGPGLLLARLRESGLLDAGLKAAAHPGTGERETSPGADPEAGDAEPAAKASTATSAAPDGETRPATDAKDAKSPKDQATDTAKPRPRPGPTPRQAAAMDSAAALHRYRRAGTAGAGGSGKLGKADASVPSSWWAQAVAEGAELAEGTQPDSDAS
jgi:hypothetical protein